MTKLTPLEIMRRSEEIDDLEQAHQNLDKTDLAAVRALRERNVKMLHRLENDLP